MEPLQFLSRDLPPHFTCSVIHKLFIVWHWKLFCEQNRLNPCPYILYLRKEKLIKWIKIYIFNHMCNT